MTKRTARNLRVGTIVLLLVVILVLLWEFRIYHLFSA